MQKTYKGVTIPDPEHFKYYIDRPIEFTKDIIFKRIDNKKFILDPDQEKILKSVAMFPNVAVRSGHGSGKSSSIAFLIMWFLCTRRDSLVVVTGPKADQLKKTLWTEISRWLMYCPVKEMLRWHPETVQHIANPDAWYATYVTTKSSGNLQGFHCEHLLFVVDEAFSVEDKIFEVIEGAITGRDGKNKRLFCGNPTASSGYIFDIFHEEYYKNNPEWKLIHIDSSKSTIADPKYAERMERKYGKDSDIYRVRVLGEFPAGDEKAYIPLVDCEKAKGRTVEPRYDQPIEIGVDIARFGNDASLICVRRGHHVYPLHRYTRYDNVEIAAEVIRLVKEYREMVPRWNGYISVKIDDSPVSGGVVDILRRDTSNKLNIVPLGFGWKATDQEHYVNMASEMWGNFKERLQWVDLPDDDDLIAELSTRRLATHKSGRIYIEEKDEYKKRHGDSPDRADAVILCFAQSPQDDKTISSFSRSNKRQFRDFDIDFSSIRPGTHTMLASMWMNADMETAVTLSIYDNEVARLYVLDELEFHKPRPDVIVKEVAAASIRIGVMGEAYRQPTNDPVSYYEAAKRWQWIANNAMFGLSAGARKMEGARAYSPAYEFCVKPFNVAIAPCLQYDSAGAASTFSMIMSKGKMTINSRCEELANCIDADKKESPLLLSVLGTVAYIGPAITRQPGTPLKDYSRAKEEAVKRLQTEYR